ncbi:hypothetical protein ASD21_09135 [Caulobacter sp. Root1455]|uniref:ferritin-like domain-containing protein n=1 Tax=Caulobacter sp. Root1455 TaxID=1736465 RepID=UPI0006FDB116|nr:ferritin-like domain-containing protein [Caulobacter sp. Root1455]KQY95488.1 hypothetical protein ASD21_09135 [Caulobacter sp. Root1455]
MTRTLSASAQAPRDPALKKTDKAALRAIAQAAVDVELFTIPLYMTSLYSIQGMHAITGQGNDFYQGRLWPGSKTSANPVTANDQAFNLVFSVFIQEMLHLQMAANMATVLGVSPNFTDTALQDDRHGWTCYGPANSVIPNIIDLKDTIHHEDVPVNVGPLSDTQLRLFIAIEQPEADARANIKQGKEKDYFPEAPFADWKPGQPLPRFGTIGWMYQCYYDYLSLTYSDGSTLWDLMFTPTAVQNDLFNSFSSPGHPMREFMGFETTIATTDQAIAFEQMISMMDAITDQGEGSEIQRRPQLLQAVKPKYQPSNTALRADYPSYDDAGTQIPSADAVARSDNDPMDHYERFKKVAELLPQVVTWPMWLEKNKAWTAKELQGPDYDPSNPLKLPTPDELATALNALNEPSARAESHKLLSQAVIGAIAGVTTVLNDYWNPPATGPVLFPFPSMAGSGDRMSIAWAVLGLTPDLSIGLDPAKPGKLYHSCQALDLDGAGDNACAAVEIFHTCRGSNNCHAQGGCGFVQPISGGGNCGSAVVTRGFGGGCAGPGASGGCGLPPQKLYSAPSDNRCGGFGGCAVPISASQVFPNTGQMQLYDFVENSQGKDGWQSVAFGDPMLYQRGEKVHDVAYRAYQAVMEHRGKSVPADPPGPDNLRLVFPPST